MSVDHLVLLARLKRQARKSAKRMRHLPRGSAPRRAMAQELRDWRAKYEMERFKTTGTKRGRVKGL